jgi:SAM-dependent methyltransferase
MIEAKRKEHWDAVYQSKGEADLSWYQEEPHLSLKHITSVASQRGGQIIDVGGGTSGLVDRLLEVPFERVAILDISGTALGKATARLGERAERVWWIGADVTEAFVFGTFDIWHNRAVFHFLTHPADRRSYVELARKTVPTGGHVVIATFAENGPMQCSKLDVCRYNAKSLACELGDGFSLVSDATETHQTPWGSSQPFFYGVFRRI